MQLIDECDVGYAIDNVSRDGRIWLGKVSMSDNQPNIGVCMQKKL